MGKTVFVDGDPSHGVLGTIVSAAFLNLIQQHVHDGADADGHAPLAHLVGEPFPWLLETPPAGTLELDGAAISRTTYAALFALWGTNFGVGNGTSTFNLPDFRGLFPRGWAHGSANDPDRASRTNRGDGTTGDHVGTKQASEFSSHIHQVGNGTNYLATDTEGAQEEHITVHDTNIAAAILIAALATTGGNETRPINIAVMWVVRY